MCNYICFSTTHYNCLSSNYCISFEKVNPDNIHSLGIIAGSRELPLTIAKEARRLVMAKIIAVAFHNETSPEIEELVDDVEWIRVGQLSRLIKFFIKLEGIIPSKF